MTEQDLQRQCGEDKFWCDAFDGDLYKLVPEAKDELAPVADVKLWTCGSSTGGHLNHPACWNHERGMISWFSVLPTHGHSSFYSCDKDLVECTFFEAIRDAWVHGLVVMLFNREVWNGFILRVTMTNLLMDARKVFPMKSADVLDARFRVRASIADAVIAFEALRK